MQIADNKVVALHYTLTNVHGETIDSSVDQPPLAYLHGHGNLIAGLEQAVTGKIVGDKLTVTLQPEEGYGLYDEALVEKLPRSAFQGVEEIQVGMQFQAQYPSGHRVVTIIKIEGDEITIDGNHPLADEIPTFEIEVAEIREATEEELAHGHAHSPDEHHH